MSAFLASLVAVLGTLGGSLGALLLQQRATARAEQRRELRTAGAAALAALTEYRRTVYVLSTLATDADRSNAVAAVRESRAALTAARDALLLVADDPDVHAAMYAAVDAAYALGDDTEQEHVTTGRPAALNAHNALLRVLSAAVRAA